VSGSDVSPPSDRPNGAPDPGSTPANEPREPRLPGASREREIADARAREEERAIDPPKLDPEGRGRVEGIAVGERVRHALPLILRYSPIAYAAAVVLRDSPHPLPLRLVALGLAFFATRRLGARAEELGDRARRASQVAVVAGIVGILLSVGIPRALVYRGASVPLAAATLSLGIAAAAALRSCTAIGGLGGLGTAKARTLATTASLLGVAWVLDALVEASTAVAPFVRVAGIPLDDPLVGGSLATIHLALAGLTVLHLLVARWIRRHELGAFERHDLVLGAAAVSAPISATAAMALLPFDPVTQLDSSTLLATAAIALLIGTAVAQLVRDPILAATWIARLWVALVFGGVAWVAAELTAPYTSPRELVPIALGVLVGLSAATLGRALGVTERHAATMEDALLRARAAAASTTNDDVARETLLAARVLANGHVRFVPGMATARLLTVAPLREIWLDGAGEPRSKNPVPDSGGVIDELRDPSLPSEIERAVPRAALDLLGSEPLGVVRADVLRELEVRRPDLREALKWCNRLEAAAAIALVADGELEGILLVPHGPRVSRIGLVHARVFRTLARTVASRLALGNALARESHRARYAEHRAGELEHERDRAEARAERLAHAVEGTALPLASQIEVSGYAPSSRSLRADLDAIAKTDANLFLLHRHGTDPSPWAARLHRQRGQGGAFHVTDAARTDGRSLERWLDPTTSPLELARDGTLLVLAAHRLPTELQAMLVRALAFHEGPAGDPTPLMLRVVLAVPVDDPEEPEDSWRATFEPALLERVRERALAIPKLARRTEDLRALTLDRLATLGIARRGEPLGVSDEALQMLVEHPWRGDDQELSTVLVKAAQRASGQRVEAWDVAAAIRGA
jgi:hypothetical protein